MMISWLTLMDSAAPSQHIAGKMDWARCRVYEVPEIAHQHYMCW